MVLTLYGFHLSTCTQRVAIVLLEKKVAFKFVEIDMRKGEHKSAEHLKRQPFGQIPVLEVRRVPHHLKNA
jgi:glutathione S-transferase